MSSTSISFLNLCRVAQLLPCCSDLVTKIMFPSHQLRFNYAFESTMEICSSFRCAYDSQFDLWRCPLISFVWHLRLSGKFDESLVRIYCRQILLGLQYLHKNNIVHRDIKGKTNAMSPSHPCPVSAFAVWCFVVCQVHSRLRVACCVAGGNILVDTSGVCKLADFGARCVLFLDCYLCLAIPFFALQSYMP